MKIGVIGEGAWGTAIASLLADNNHEVMLWCQDRSVANDIIHTSRNHRYLPHFPLDTQHITPIVNIQELIHCEYIFVTTPVKYLYPVLSTCISFADASKQWVFLCKGIDKETGKLPTQLAQNLLSIPANNVYVISGPSYAHDVMLKQPTGVVLGGHDVQYIQQLITTSYFYGMHHPDLTGIQVAGAFKNVIALTMGILDAMGYEHNTKALAFYKSLIVLQELIEIFGGNPHTCWTLAGVGDAILTSWSSKSRNFIMGQEIGSGKNFTNSTSMLPESINTLQALYQHTPTTFVTLLYEIIFRQGNKEALLEWIKIR